MSFQIQSLIMDMRGITATQKMVLMVLGEHASLSGDAIWPSVATIADKACCSERAAQYALRWAEKQGICELKAREQTERKTRIYRLNLNRIAQFGVQDLQDRGAGFAETAAPDALQRPRVQEMHPTGARDAPEPVLEPIHTPSVCLTTDISPTGEPAGQEKPDERPKRRSPATFLPADWEPDSRCIEYARAKGLTDDEIRWRAEIFRNYWTGLGGKDAAKRDWLATWRNHVLACINDGKLAKRRRLGNGNGVLAGPGGAQAQAGNGKYPSPLRAGVRALARLEGHAADGSGWADDGRTLDGRAESVVDVGADRGPENGATGLFDDAAEAGDHEAPHHHAEHAGKPEHG